LTWHIAAGPAALPVTRLHRPARDPATRHLALQAVTELAAPARLLKAAAEAAGENGDPRRSREFEAVVSAQGADAPPVRTDG